jgi:hypothetical protein
MIYEKSRYAFWINFASTSDRESAIFLLSAATHTMCPPSNRRVDLVPPQLAQREVRVSPQDLPGLTVAAQADASFFTQGRN